MSDLALIIVDWLHRALLHLACLQVCCQTVAAISSTLLEPRRCLKSSYCAGNLLQALTINQVPVPAPELVAGDLHFVPVGSPTQLPDVPEVPSMAPLSMGTPSLAASG